MLNAAALVGRAAPTGRFSPLQAACRAPQAFAAGDGQGDAVERLVVVDERGFAAFGCVQKGAGPMPGL